MQNPFPHFLNLLFPKICVACADALEQNEEYICLKCLYHLPKTDFHNVSENEMEKRFWGKVPIERATAFFYFSKNSSVQKILYQLKYRGNKEIGESFGKYLGIELSRSADFRNADVIVPVPLHAKRLRKRGYNQSEWIAKGIAKQWNKPLDVDNLYRAIENPTQTNKGLYERWENVNDIFKLKDNTTFRNKHVLLIDDVMTTGATIEACANAILQSENAKVSVITLAIA